MRHILRSLPILLAIPAMAFTQQPAQPNPDQMLPWVLKNWEEAMGKLGSFSATCTRTAEDKTFGGKEEYSGQAKFLRSKPPDPSRALLELHNKKDPSKYEKFLYTGVALYEWVPSTKVLRVHKMPPAKAGQPAMDENIVALLTGMTSAAAQKRYTMKWVPDKENKNKFYHYIQIFPKAKEDKADFTEARLVLWSKDFMPRQIWYHEPNGNTKTWDFQVTPNDPKVTPLTFTPPQGPPQGWRQDVVQAPPAVAGPPKK
jgi:TIGR03009 family protein